MTSLAKEIEVEIKRTYLQVSARAGSVRFLRIACWFTAVTLGAIEAWCTRSTMFPDGVSYLDIGEAYWRGDWHNVVNAYWSPFYPWILGLFLKVFRPSLQWQFPLVHLVNFLIYVVALAAFDFFLMTFLDQQIAREEMPDGEIGLPTWAWLVTGYSAFMISALFLVTISFVSGDMLVAAIIFVAGALILRMRRRNATSRSFALLGFILGIGYLCKTVMLLMAWPFMAAAVLTQCGQKKKIRCAATSLFFFFLVCGPFVVLLSMAEGRPTFGDSGKINYLMNVGTTQFFTPHEPDAKHPVRKLAAISEAYEYDSPVGGTYPLWYDPSYWHEGIVPHYSLWRQVRTLLLALAECAWILFNVRMGLVISTVITVLYAVSTRIRENFARAAALWILWLPAMAGIALYSFVVIEPRYVAALFCILWIVALSGVRLPDSLSSRWLMAGAVIVLAGLTCLGVSWQIERARDQAAVAESGIATPLCVTVAEALSVDGIMPGDKLAIISDWLFPSRQGAYISYLVHARIIAETRPEYFWSANASVKARLIEEFGHAGARAILTYKPPQVESGWQRLANSNYYLYRMNGPGTSSPKGHP